ncbi:MAG TPA: hypothetical protein VF938_00240 [Candidatus Angelobacter sp.]
MLFPITRDNGDDVISAISTCWLPRRGRLRYNPPSFQEFETMPQGYNVPYVAKDDVPYWLYKFGQGPKATNTAGTIPKGGLIHVQGPAGNWGGTHQSGYLMGVGRILVRIGDFPARTGSEHEFLIVEGSRERGRKKCHRATPAAAQAVKIAHVEPPESKDYT